MNEEVAKIIEKYAGNPIAITILKTSTQTTLKGKNEIYNSIRDKITKGDFDRVYEELVNDGLIVEADGHNLNN